MKVLKWVLALLLVVVLLLAAGAAALVLFVDPNEYKPWIERKVRETTGRELQIEGELELTVFPWLGTRVAGVTLSNAPGFGKAPMLEVGEAVVRVALLPLLKGELRADEVVLEGARIRLARDAAGRTNWEDLLEALESRERTSQPAGGSAGAPPIRSFLIGGVRLEDAELQWSDARTGTRLDVRPLDLRTGPVAPGRPVDVSLRAAIKTNEPAVELQVKLESTVRPDVGGGGTVSADPLTLDLEARGPALKGRVVRSTLRGPLRLFPSGPRVQAPELKLDARVSGEGLPGDGAALGVRTRLDADFRPGKGTLQAEPLDVDLDGVALRGGLHAAGLPDKPDWRLRLAAAPFVPRQVLERWGVSVDTADPKVLQRARLDLDARGGNDQVDLRSLKAELDDIHLEASGSVRGFDRPAIRFSAAIDAVDADRYLPPSRASAAASAGEGKGAPGSGGEPIGLPVETLRGLDLDGELRLGRLKISGIQMQKLTARVRARDGKLAIEPFGLALYGGRVQGGASTDVREPVPRFGAHVDARSIAVGDLLTDLRGAAAKIRGTGAFSAKLASRGDRLPQIKRGLSGQVSFSLVDGALRDRKLARTLERVIAFLQNREPRPAGEEVIFESVRATGQIRQGVLHNDDLKMITPLLLAKGAGRVDLGADSVDYVLRVALATGSKEQKRLFVPITIKGPFTDLAYGVDLAAVAKDRLRHEVEKQVDEQMNRELGKQLEQVAPGAGGAVGEALKKGLGGLLGR